MSLRARYFFSLKAARRQVSGMKGASLTPPWEAFELKTCLEAKKRCSVGRPCISVMEGLVLKACTDARMLEEFPICGSCTHRGTDR